jgi:hypothetical protein
MQAGEVFVQRERMATQTANTQTLPQNRVEILQEPFKFLQDALETTDIDSTRKAAIAQQLESESDSTSTPALREQLRTVEFTDAQKNKRTLDDLVQIDADGVKSKPSLGSLMKEAGLRTICSVSGTTIDIVGGLHAHVGEAKTKEMLQSLKNFVDDGCADPTKLSDEFKNLFLSVAMYMQSGQYHSAGEVLGGLYCTAITLFPEGNDPKNFDQIAPKFQKMWEALQAQPENFFPLSGDDKKKLNEQAPGIIKNLQEQHRETIKGRREQGMETLATLQGREEQALQEDFMKQHQGVQ